MHNSYATADDSYTGVSSLFKVPKRSHAVSTSLEVSKKSYYDRIPTQNVKFERFVQLIFKSKFSSADI